MRGGLREKFLHSEQNQELLDLLMSSHPYPLRSLKCDCFWGFHPEHGGENMLAKGSGGQSRSHFTELCF